MKLKRSYYLQPTLKVAQDLVGKFLIHKTREKIYSAEIVETEAYLGFKDKASHARRGKTKRNQMMFLKGGFAYVYLIYGIYYCFNIVTEKENYPAAVLIRGLDYETASGPGKLCRAFKIGKDHNGLDLTKEVLWVEDRGIKCRIVALPRVGVAYAGKCATWPWRFLKQT